jgi:hypothetical protein
MDHGPPCNDAHTRRSVKAYAYHRVLLEASHGQPTWSPVAGTATKPTSVARWWSSSAATAASYVSGSRADSTPVDSP